MNDTMLKTIEEYYELYRQTFRNIDKDRKDLGPIESVCGNKEMRAILTSIPVGLIIEAEDEYILNKMRERVGQPGINPNKVKASQWPSFGELPRID